jgi:hypothetical protein
MILLHIIQQHRVQDLVGGRESFLLIGWSSADGGLKTRCGITGEPERISETDNL